MSTSAAPTPEALAASTVAPAVSVIVMAYNEAANVERVFTDVAAAAAASGRTHELLIVDDGSTDGTGDAGDRLARVHRTARVIHHRENLGLGGVYRTGFRESRGELVTFYPADGQFSASHLAAFLAAMDDGADMALGYVTNTRRTVAGVALSLAERLLYRVIVGRMPRFQGLFMFRRALLDAVPLRSTGRGWAVVMEFILRVYRGPYRVVNVPTTIGPRLSGRSKVNNWRTIYANLRQLLQLRRYL